jgi:CheY-like chemotaxis protein/HPt (histidine-containing phosphotransfer) domain-containing protein
MERLGFLPDTAEDGRKALAALENQTYDLIFMDCVMPVMNGFDTAREIRGKNALKQIPIIAMTAHAGAEIEETCLACGMNDHISKPVTSEGLAQMVDRWTQVSDTMELLELPQIPVPTEMIFDKEDLIRRVMGDDHFALELAVEFLKDLPRRRSLLKSAILRREPEAVRQEAHALKGSATNLSAPALREISCRIEAAAATGKTETAHHLLRELDSQIQNFKNALILSKLISLDDC